MRIRQQLVRSTARTSAGVNGRQTITIHETANLSAGADAGAHANLQSRLALPTSSWHWTVDDEEAVQSYTHDRRCWHAGRIGPGLWSSIAIETCVDAGSDWRRTVENLATLTRQIMAQEGIPLDRVVQHNHWSGKNCPTRLRTGYQGITWTDLLRMIAGGEATPPPTPSITETPKPVPAPQAPRRHSASIRPRTAGETARIQRILAKTGHYRGLIDDDYGQPTKNAVAAYQRGQAFGNLYPDGDWGPTTDAHYRWVVQLQTALNQWRSTSPKLRVDGDYGGLTAKAVAAWQRRNARIYGRHGGSLIDGLAGRATCAGLNISTHP